MASISSLTGSSSTSSIYGNRNVISGLASGLDTEALIENSISGYKQKIMNLQKQQVKTEWKQDAYRSIISKMVGLSQKYTSYTSGTNLFSNSFFNRAVNTVATGKYADKVGATGKSANNISITSIDSVARAARYSASASDLISAASQPEALNWAKDGVTESTIAGSMSLRYGSNDLTIRFGEDDIFESQQDVVDSINKQLSEQTIKSSGGASKASEFIEAKLDAGKIVLAQKEGKDNNFYISSASDSIKDNLLGGEGQIGENVSTNKFVFAAAKDGNMTKQTSLVEHMQGRTMSFTFNGTTKTIQLGDTAKRDEDGKLLEGEKADAAYDKFKADVEAATTNEAKSAALAEFIQSRVNEKFGENKIEVKAKDGALDIQAVKSPDAAGKDQNNYTLTVTSSAGRALGLGKNGIGNTLNTSWGLEDVLGADFFAKKADDGTIATDENGKPIYEEKELIINGKSLGKFNKDTKIESVITAINNNADAGVSVNFSKLTNQFVFTTRETGADQKIEMGDGLAQKLFGKVPEPSDDEGSTYTAGADSKFTVKINGDEKTMTRSTNVVDLDGMSVTLKGTFGKYNEDGTENVDYEPIEFNSTTDSDTIVDAIKSFVNDYNAMTKEIHDAYSTLPYQKSSGSFANYEPLVGDETDGYSDSELERYEEKAKQGILFGDSDLRNLYQSLTGFIQGSGVDGATLRSIGIETSYDDGLTTISLNETKLREALSADPDKVRDAFTKTTENGASSNGLMQNIKTTMDRYASTSIATPGILISKAGTPLSSYSLQNNQLQNQMDSLETQIEKWQDKMSDRIDYYTNQFTRLEQLINQMNSQSSALAGLMGG